MLHADSWMITLPAMVTGMIGIFLVIAVIMGSVYLLNYLTGRKQ
ncbi:oxaloacetate decarboxylase [Acidaminobacterium chupaoyuni]